MREQSGARRIALSVKGVDDYARLAQFKAVLSQSVRGVKDVQERSMSDGKADLDVTLVRPQHRPRDRSRHPEVPGLLGEGEVGDAGRRSRWSSRRRSDHARTRPHRSPRSPARRSSSPRAPSPRRRRPPGRSPSSPARRPAPRAARRRSSRSASAVFEGDALETQKRTRLEVKLADGSVLRLGPSSKADVQAAAFGKTRGGAEGLGEAARRQGLGERREGGRRGAAVRGPDRERRRRRARHHLPGGRLDRPVGGREGVQRHRRGRVRHDPASRAPGARSRSRRVQSPSGARSPARRRSPASSGSGS